MGIDVPAAASEEEKVSAWEAHVEATKNLPLQAQEELRRMLVSADQTLRDRIIRLLNPRGVTVVELSDERFRDHYEVTASDNYGRMSGEWDQTAIFDAARGYYVNIVVQVLRSPKKH